MERRAFISGITVGLLAAPLAAEAQPAGRVWRVGILDGDSPTQERQAHWNVFREALRNAGYVEGKNIAFEFRWGLGDVAILVVLARELVSANVDLIVIAGTPAALAAKQTTASIPIVLVIAGDPVGTGLALTLRRPGGNVTGLTTLSTELSGKAAGVSEGPSADDCAARCAMGQQSGVRVGRTRHGGRCPYHEGEGANGGGTQPR